MTHQDQTLRKELHPNGISNDLQVNNNKSPKSKRLKSIQIFRCQLFCQMKAFQSINCLVTLRFRIVIFIDFFVLLSLVTSYFNLFSPCLKIL